ncbi:MAG: hypothetical protein QOJ80_6343 [Mycobacterium sp.]|nr:hypothetical protein [Mycobacterium sp.]
MSVDVDWSYRGLQAVILSNRYLRVVVLPELGGKVWQVTDLRNGRDLLWHNPRATAHRVEIGSTYDDVFFGGWDELFPNDEPEQLAGEPYPDHGELWTAAWDWRLDDQHRLTLSTRTPISACHFTKTITLVDNEPHLDIAWRIHNQGLEELPYLWKQHVAVPTDEPATLTMGARTVYLEDFGRPRAGRPGTEYAWPYLLQDGVRHDMRPTLPRETRAAEFQYATELDAGWCAVTYADGSGIGLAFDPEVFPSCWTFASHGGWRAHEVLILEPCTGYPSSVIKGIAAGTHRTLPADGVVTTALMMVAYQGMSEVTAIATDGTVTGTRSEVAPDAR